MRFLYSAAWLLLLPFAFLYLLRRAWKQPEYLRHWGERLGGAPRMEGPVIWLHAVSVGETRAAAPVIQALRQRYPNHALLLTHATPTGRAAGRELYGDGVTQCYLPYDFPLFVHRFLNRVRPRLGVIMETEVWPNLFAACARRGVPVFLANARLSEKSARGYARVRALTAPALQALAGIAAQTEDDARRLRALGAGRIEVTGNVKFDVTPPADAADRAADLRQRLAGRFVFLAASTREGEEALILEALERTPIPGLLLVLVPRHPQRFEEVARLLAERGEHCVRRSRDGRVATDTRVFLGDSMGELAAYYQAADLAYVGGSLLPLGGQNLIEAAAAGCPMLLGPHTFNFAEAADKAVERGAALRVADAGAMAAEAARLRQDPAARAAMRLAGLAFAAENQGATRRLLSLLPATLDQRVMRR